MLVCVCVCVFSPSCPYPSESIHLLSDECQLHVCAEALNKPQSLCLAECGAGNVSEKHRIESLVRAPVFVYSVF